MNTIPTAIDNMADLRAAMLLLENRQKTEGEDLRDWFRVTYQSMRPVNLIKSALTEVTESQDLKDHMVSAGVGLVVGHASKAVFESVSDSPVKGLLGTALQFGVTNVVSRHPELVIAAGRGLFGLMRGAWRAARDNSHTDDEAEVEHTDQPHPHEAHSGS